MENFIRVHICYLKSPNKAPFVSEDAEIGDITIEIPGESGSLHKYLLDADTKQDDKDKFALTQLEIVENASLLNYISEESGSEPVHFNCSYELKKLSEFNNDIGKAYDYIKNQNTVYELKNAGQNSNYTLNEELDFHDEYVFFPRYIRTKGLNQKVYNGKYDTDVNANNICTFCYCNNLSGVSFGEIADRYSFDKVNNYVTGEDYDNIRKYWEFSQEITFNEKQTGDIIDNLSFQGIKTALLLYIERKTKLYLPYSLSDYKIVPKNNTLLYDKNLTDLKFVLNKKGELEDYSETNFGQFHDENDSSFFGGMNYFFCNPYPVKIYIEYERASDDMDLPEGFIREFSLEYKGDSLTQQEYDENIAPLYDFCKDRNYDVNGFYVNCVEPRGYFKLENPKVLIDGTELWEFVNNIIIDLDEHDKIREGRIKFIFNYEKKHTTKHINIKYSTTLNDIKNIFRDLKDESWSTSKDGKYYTLSKDRTYTNGFSEDDYNELINEIKSDIKHAGLRDIVIVLGFNKSYNEAVEALKNSDNLDLYTFFSVKELNVNWYDRSQELIKEEEVLYGESAIEPEYSPGEDYVFIKWDKEFGEIKEDTDIHALCLPTWDYLTSLCDSTEKLDEVLSDMENTGLLSKEKLNKIQNNLIMVCTGYKPNDIPEIEGESGFTPFNPEGGSSNEEAAADSVINVKNLEIIFKPKKYLEETRRYVEDKLMPYITEMIPSTTIFRYKFEGDEPEVKQRKPYIGSKFED